MRTVEELQDRLEQLGRPRSWVGRDDDPQAARDEGVTLFRRLGDARWETFVVGRGDERHVATHDSEAEAVQAYADTAIPAPSPDDAPSEEQRRATVQRMQAKAAETLRRLEAHDRAQGQA